MRRFVVLFCPVLVLVVLIGRYVSDSRLYHSQTILLLPVSVLQMGQDTFSSYVRLRYDNFIPVRDLSDKKGVIVVDRLNDGRVVFVSVASDRPLRPREVLLKYEIVPSLSFDDQKKEANIRFASDFFRFIKKKKRHLSAVRYAVVHVDDAGNTVLTGLADGNGILLVKGLRGAFFDSHRNSPRK